MKIIFSLILISLSVFGQNVLQKQFDYAEDLFKQEKYYDAVTELLRLSFFDNEKQFEYKTNLLLGFSYREGGKLSESLFYFTKAVLSSKNIEEEIYAQKELLKIYILRRQTSQAEKILSDFENKKEHITKEEILYWKGWVAMFNDDWQKSSEYFSQIDSAEILYNLSIEVENKKYSVSFAKGISYFIPGAGQFYTGNYFSGLLSLGWNVLWGFTAVNAFKAERIFDGFAVTLFLWTRFYNGNIFNAGKFAEEKNIEIVNKAYNFLQYEFKGIKP